MNTPNITMIMVPEEEWRLLKENQQEILSLLQEIKSNSKISSVPVGYVTAKEFMEAVRIKRTKFDQLVLTNKIRTIKKRRKVYVPATVIDRYFKDASIP